MASSLLSLPPQKLNVMKCSDYNGGSKKTADFAVTSIASVDAMHVSRIAGVVKAFRGDISGEFVTRGVVLGTMAGIDALECRVPPEAIAFLVPVLRMDYAVTVETSVEGRHIYDVWIPGVPDARPLRLRVHPTCRRMWQTEGTVVFDIDALAVDSHSMFLRMQPMSFRGVDDRLSFVIDRVRRGTFCVLAATTTDRGAAMQRAVGLVSAGRVMDDAVMGRSAWVVASWETFVRNPGSVRRARGPLSAFQLSSSSLPLPSKHDVCPLCQETFALDDLVINLGCNHNFHGACSSNDGICTWMSTHDTCPCCRENLAV